ncbi:hypothetical protein CHELA1G11_20432 [Hyphomicrobiales bacterium]|nr:hypothetical protein CHELA1G11_20432 [Hyphomicrobiales bacterium]CAH1690185.1 hypothetical protein CHELA1G2_20745 [Hyphomicrobiales bacterium]
MFRPFCHQPASVGVLVIIGLFLAVRIFLPSQAEAIFSDLQVRILAGFGWLYLLAIGVILASVLLLCFSHYSDLKLGPDDSTPGLQLHVVGRHVVRRRDGHRPDVLRRGRADDPLSGPSDRRAAIGRCRSRGHVRHLLALGHTRLGRLCGGRAVACLFRLSLQSASHHSLGSLSATQGAHQRSHQPRGRYLRHFTRSRGP